MLHQRTRPLPDAEVFVYPAQVADLLHVSPKTITSRAQEGRLSYWRTLGGHRRSPTTASLVQEVCDR